MTISVDNPYGLDRAYSPSGGGTGADSVEDRFVFLGLLLYDAALLAEPIIISVGLYRRLGCA